MYKPRTLRPPSDSTSAVPSRSSRQVARRFQAPASASVPLSPNAPASHDGLREPAIGSQVLPLSLVTNKPEGNWSEPSPPTYPVLLSRKRTKFKPGRALSNFRRHFQPPLSVKSRTPVLPPPL